MPVLPDLGGDVPAPEMGFAQKVRKLGAGQSHDAPGVHRRRQFGGPGFRRWRCLGDVFFRLGWSLGGGGLGGRALGAGAAGRAASAGASISAVAVSTPDVGGGGVTGAGPAQAAIVKAKATVPSQYTGFRALSGQ